MASPDLCSCGHERSQHDFKVMPKDPYDHCSGEVIALPGDPDDIHTQRRTSCCCTSFDSAWSHQLAEWDA